MLCVLILYMSGGTYSLKSTPNHSLWYLTWDLKRCFTSNKSTHYLLDYGDQNYLQESKTLKFSQQLPFHINGRVNQGRLHSSFLYYLWANSVQREGELQIMSPYKTEAIEALIHKKQYCPFDKTLPTVCLYNASCIYAYTSNNIMHYLLDFDDCNEQKSNTGNSSF